MRLLAVLLITFVLAQPALAQWDSSSYGYRKSVSFTEPAGVARSKDHIRFTVSLDSGRKSTSNRPVMYCSGTQTPLETFDVSVSGGWVTQLQAVAELDFTANEVKNCFIYYDPAYGGTTLALARSGWETAGGTDIVGCNVVDLAPATTACYSHYNALNYYGSDIVICGANDRMKLNAWCYFKAPSTKNEQFRLWSDDGAVLYMDGSTLITDDSCHSPRWSSWAYRNTEAGRFYAMKVFYAEQGGNARIQPVYDGDNVFDSECYGFYGDEWTVASTVGGEEIRNQAPVFSSKSANPNPVGWYQQITYNVNFNDADNDNVACTFRVYSPRDGSWRNIGSASGTSSCALTYRPFTCRDSGSSVQWLVDYNDGNTHNGTWGPWTEPAVTGACCSNPINFTYRMDYVGTPLKGTLTFSQGDWNPVDYHCFTLDGAQLGSFTSFPSSGIEIVNKTFLNPGAHTLLITLSSSAVCAPDSLNSWNVTNINLELIYYQ